MTDVPPIAVTTSPRTFAKAILAVVACRLVPQTSLAAGVCIVVLLTTAVVATAFGMAYLATHELSIREGDVLEFRNGERGRVRAVRWWYMVVDTYEGATVLVPNTRVRAFRAETQRSA